MHQWDIQETYWLFGNWSGFFAYGRNSSGYVWLHMWRVGHAVGPSSHCGVKRSHSTHCCWPETEQPRWMLYAWAYRLFHFQKTEQKEGNQCCSVRVSFLRGQEGATVWGSLKLPSPQKGGKRKKSGLWEGDTCSPLSPPSGRNVWQVILQAVPKNTQSCSHSFQMFSVRRQYTDTCERFWVIEG